MNKRSVAGLLVLLLSFTFVFSVAAADKTVIFHSGAFGGEIAQLNELLIEDYGEPSVIYGKLGRKYHIWETGDKTRLITTTTKVSMHNAVLSSALVFQNLPKKYHPDLATHGGICGAVLQESNIMDVYAPYAVAFSNQGLYGPKKFKPFSSWTWSPNKDKAVHPIWIRTDPNLTDLLAQGVQQAKKDSDFQNLWEQSGLPYQPTLYRDVVHVSSTYFVANDELNAKWAQLFKIDPNLDKSNYDVNWEQTSLNQLIWGPYDGELHQVGGLAMEAAGVVWTLRQFNVPVAVLRYPSDKARSEAQVQIKKFGQTAAAVGGYSFYYGLKNIIGAVEKGKLTVNNGKTLLKD